MGIDKFKNIVKSMVGLPMEEKTASPEHVPNTRENPQQEQIMNLNNSAATAEADDDEYPSLRDAIVRALRTVYDPEIPVNIYELGLIYSIDISPENEVAIRMTLTAPSCPAAEQLPPEVEAKARAVPGVKDVKLDLVWEPPWNKEMMSEAARLTLGIE